MDFARQQSPASKVLLICSEPDGGHLLEEHVEFYSRKGPAALIETVGELLSGHRVRKGQTCGVTRGQSAETVRLRT